MVGAGEKAASGTPLRQSEPDPAVTACTDGPPSFHHRAHAPPPQHGPPALLFAAPQGNQLNGTLPDWMTGSFRQQVENLWLGSNQLQGSIPATYSTASPAACTDVSDNLLLCGPPPLGGTCIGTSGTHVGGWVRRWGAAACVCVGAGLFSQMSLPHPATHL